MAKKYTTIGSMNTKREKDEQGRVSYNIKLDSKVKLIVNGEEVTSGYLNVSRPTDKFERMLKAGALTEEEYDRKLADFDKGGKLEFIKFEITAVTGN